MKPIALITGGSKGIGLELAKQFAKAHYDLILVARNSNELAAAVDDLKPFGVEVDTFAADVSTLDFCSRLAQQFTDKLPRIEVLVNNAGTGRIGMLHTLSQTELEQILALNVVALTRLTQFFLQQFLVAKRGKILNVASTAAFTPGPYYSTYHASKAYVVSFSNALAQEYREQGIIVSALCPGVVDTTFHQTTGTDKTNIRSKFQNSMSAQAVAEIGFAGLMQGKRVIVPGIMNKIQAFCMRRVLPDALLLRIVAFMEKPRA